METIRVIQVGLGPIGQGIVKFLLEREGLELVAAVDTAADKIGKDVGQLCGLDKKIGIKVRDDLSETIEDTNPDVAIVSTASSMEKVAPLIEQILSASVAVVTTCEEMAYPWMTQGALSKRLDESARKAGVAVLATGVNPGFLMDFLPLCFTAICQKVEKIKVQRIQDASMRRVPFQQKIGAGLTLEQFEAKRENGTIRHVGLTESMHMIAARLGWKLEKTEDVLEPVVADKEITSGYIPIKPGMVAGVRQTGRGYVNGEEVITLEFVAAVGQNDPADVVEIDGQPKIKSIIPGGINGDVATCAIAVNAIGSIVSAEPGLRTMADMPPITFFNALT